MSTFGQPDLEIRPTRPWPGHLWRRARPAAGRTSSPVKIPAFHNCLACKGMATQRTGGAGARKRPPAPAAGPSSLPTSARRRRGPRRAPNRFPQGGSGGGGDACAVAAALAPPRLVLPCQRGAGPAGRAVERREAERHGGRAEVWRESGAGHRRRRRWAAPSRPRVRCGGGGGSSPAGGGWVRGGASRGWPGEAISLQPPLTGAPMPSGGSRGRQWGLCSWKTFLCLFGVSRPPQNREVRRQVGGAGPRRRPGPAAEAGPCGGPVRCRPSPARAAVAVPRLYKGYRRVSCSALELLRFDLSTNSAEN